MRPIEHLGVVTALPSEQLEVLRAIGPDEARVVIVDGAGIADGAGLMMRFADGFALPNDHVWTWPALADSIWGALQRMDARRVLVVLTDAHELAGRSMDELLGLVLLFAELGREVSTADGTRPFIRLSLVLLGDGPAFR